jgi:PhoPQ-activated pathogenicity-related protein
MKNLKSLLHQFKGRKLSLTAVVLIAIASAVAGAFAAIVVNTTSYNFAAEAGTLHQSSSAFTVTDNGFIVAINTFSNNQSNTLTLAAGNWQVQNAITIGHWIDSVSFSMPSPATGTHVATIKIQNGGGTVSGTTIVTFTSGTWTTSASSNGTVTCYVDTGLTSITSPLTIYVTVT